MDRKNSVLEEPPEIKELCSACRLAQFKSLKLRNVGELQIILRLPGNRGGYANDVGQFALVAAIRFHDPAVPLIIVAGQVNNVLSIRGE